MLFDHLKSVKKTKPTEGELEATFGKAQWQHTLYFGVCREQQIIEAIFASDPDALEQLPTEFRDFAAILALSVESHGTIPAQDDEDDSSAPTFDPERIQIARWPWAIARYARLQQANFKDDFLKFESAVRSHCRDIIIRESAAGQKTFVITPEKTAQIERGLRVVLAQMFGVNPQDLPRVFHDMAAPICATRVRTGRNAVMDALPINSYFIDDLNQILNADRLPPALNEFLTLAMVPDAERIFTTAQHGRTVNAKILAETIGEDKIPAGCWPKVVDRELYWAQQLARNIVASGGEKLFAVNGPPGTGKTTLLRDIIADFVTRRACVLAKFDSADDAWAGSSCVGVATINRFVEPLRGFEIVVASQNNAAVENITRELPAVSTLPSGFPLTYFKPIADELQRLAATVKDDTIESEEQAAKPVVKCWGLVSAPLGNSVKRSQFSEVIFPHRSRSALAGYVLERAKECLSREQIVAVEAAARAEFKNSDEYSLKLPRKIIHAASPVFEGQFKAAQHDFKSAMERWKTISKELTNLRTVSGRMVELSRKLEELKTRSEKVATAAEQVSVELTQSAANGRSCTTAYHAQGAIVKDWTELHSMTVAVEMRRHRQAERDKAFRSHEEAMTGARSAPILIDSSKANLGKLQDELQEVVKAKPPGAWILLEWWFGKFSAWNSNLARAKAAYEAAQRDYAEAVASKARLESISASSMLVVQQLDREFAANPPLATLEAAAMQKRKLLHFPGATNSVAVQQQLTVVEQRHNAILTQWREWHTRHENKKAERERLTAELEATRVAIAKIQDESGRLQKDLCAIQNSLGLVDGQKAIDLPFIAYSNDEASRQKSKPLACRRSVEARSSVFAAAIRLHEAWILASWPKFTQNLSFVVDMLAGKFGNSLDAQPLLPQAWTTINMLVPVVSTTFASAGRLFAGLPAESLGLGLIDEAGQGAPQQAVSFLNRMRRVVVVGDPMQLSPVIPMPDVLVERLMAQFRVDKVYHPKFCSTQTLADRRTRYGGFCKSPLHPTSSLWVGAPLRMHNRCAEPMFSASNAMCYDHQMILARQKEPAAATAGMRRPTTRSVWIDIPRANRTSEHHVSEDLEVVSWLLRSCVWNPDHNIYIITPYVATKNAIRERLKHDKLGTELWRKTAIGTVHTFQGKEADTVLLLLGGRTPRARAWAADPPNLINVAVTRGKEMVVIIGDNKEWVKLRPELAMLPRLKWKNEHLAMPPSEVSILNFATKAFVPRPSM